jgi:predicted GNAT family N-acyltransferase
MKLTIGNSPDIILKSQSVRHQIFVNEQDIPQKIDLDGLDEHSSHALVTENSALVGTARLYSYDGRNCVLARVAVTKEYRGDGVATKMINAMICHAKKSGFSTMEIHAHEYLKEYYEKFGFHFIQNVEMVGKHQLIEMQLNIA